MQRYILTKETKEKLDDAAVELIARSETGEKIFSLYCYIKEQTDILLYYLPEAKHFMDEEHSAEFYLAQRSRVDDLINGYFSLTHLSYTSYISNYCRLRAFSFENRIKVRTLTESAIEKDNELAQKSFYIPEYFKETELQDTEVILCMTYPYDLKTAVDNIIYAQRNEIKDMSEAEILISYFLGNIRNREKVIYLILNVYTVLTIEIQRKLARLFQVDLYLFASLSAMMEEVRGKYEKGASIQREHLISKHWVRYLTLCKAKMVEIEDVKIKEIEWQQKNCISWMRKLQKKSEKEHQGMSIRKISTELEVPISRVFNGIKEAKQMMLALFIDR